jgi:hypothetical protein
MAYTYNSSTQEVEAGRSQIWDKLYNNTLSQKKYRWNIKKLVDELGTVVHAYKPSYLGSRDLEDYCLRPAWAKSLQKTLSQPIKSWMWQLMPVIPATQEVQIGEL